jgi:hypothetical protein
MVKQVVTFHAQKTFVGTCSEVVVIVFREFRLRMQMTIKSSPRNTLAPGVPIFKWHMGKSCFWITWSQRKIRLSPVPRIQQPLRITIIPRFESWKWCTSYSHFSKGKVQKWRRYNRIGLKMKLLCSVHRIHTPLAASILQLENNTVRCIIVTCCIPRIYFYKESKHVSHTPCDYKQTETNW